MSGAPSIQSPCFSLAGEVALITGGGRGIGRATALLLARHGAHVAVVARTAAEVEQVAAEVRGLGVQSLAVCADVREAGAVEEAVERAWRSLGPLDVLVNNAAAFEPHEFLGTSPEHWEELVRQALAGTVHACRAAASRWARACRGGRIVNVSSVNGSFGMGWSSAYNVAKAGVDALTRSLAVELAPYGILVNGIAPGFVDTAMARAGGESDVESDVFRRFYVGERRIPLARAGTPEDVAGAVLFFASSACSYVTGQTLFVDGGLSITY